MSKTLHNLKEINKSYIQNLPHSKKIYEQGSRADIQVPIRKITLNQTAKNDGVFEQNPPLYVYDTTGPYTDENVHIN